MGSATCSFPVEMMRALSCALLVHMAAACVPALEPFVVVADGGVVTVPLDGGVPPDASVQVDAGRADAGGMDAGMRPDASTCEPENTWTRVPVRVTGVQLLSEVPRALGITERLQVSLVLETQCDQLPVAQVNVQPGNATDFVEVTATAFRPAASCAPAFSGWVTTVDVPGTQQGNMIVAVSWGEGEFRYERRNCEDSGCDCTPGSPRRGREEGDPCRSDCDCERPLSCLGVRPGAPARCALPCRDGLDCLPFSARCLPSDNQRRPPLTCELEDDTCLQDADCPVEFACLRGDDGKQRCVDQRAFPGAPCGCDGACGPSETCTELFPGRGNTCERLCNRDADCPQRAFVCVDGLCRLLD